MPIPNRRKEPKEKGGHAVMAVGYDDARKALIVRNSWGPAWGVNGYFLMPYKLVTDPKITFDFWTLRGVTGINVAVRRRGKRLNRPYDFRVMASSDTAKSDACN